MQRRKSPITPALANAMQAPLDISEVNGKAADRRFLQSIQETIDKAARESASRGTLKATVEMQKRLAAEAKAKREAELAAAISIVAAKEKDKGGRKNAAPDNRPTSERLAKLMGAEAITPPIDGHNTIMKAHLTQGVVEFYRDKWADEELQGARFLVKVWNDAVNGERGVTASYTGVPGAAYGPRDGGVKRGSKTETYVDAHQQMLNVEGILFAKFGAKGLNVVRWFVWETLRVARDGASMGEQMEAAGKSLAPFVKDAGRLWGITFGSLQTIFRFAYAEWVVKEEAMKRRASTPQQIEMRRAIRRHKMVKADLLEADRDSRSFKEGNG